MTGLALANKRWPSVLRPRNQRDHSAYPPPMQRTRALGRWDSRGKPLERAVKETVSRLLFLNSESLKFITPPTLCFSERSSEKLPPTT